jgi:CBS-domain-containing membrane protein
MSNTVRDAMTTPVVTVRLDTPFKHVVATVRAVGAVPVTDDAGLVLGTVCEHDLLAEKAFLERSPGWLAAARRHGERGKAEAATAASLMTSPAVTIQAEATTGKAAWLMYRHRRGSLPVVDRLGRLIGIISESDVLDGFTRQDADIRREAVRDVVARNSCSTRGRSRSRFGTVLSRCRGARKATRSGTCWPRPYGASRGSGSP